MVKLTNHDFLCLVWKIAIGLLRTSALAALKTQLTTSLEHHLESSLDGTLGKTSYVYFLLCFTALPPVYFLLCFMALLKQLQRLCTGGFIF